MMDKPHYFEEVRANATIERSDIDQKPYLAGMLRSMFRQIQKPRYVVSELLQNADDAGAIEASAYIQDGEFVFTHNGKDFTEKDFTSLCRFGYSTKHSLRTIGFRGIGFKSTFSLGDQVRLITPTLSVTFCRERFTEPVWRDLAEQPFHTSVRVAIKDDYREEALKKNLAEWSQDPASLLFFNNIQSLRIEGKEVQWKSQGGGPVPNSKGMVLSSDPEKEYLLIRSPDEDFPSEALEEIKEERMVPTDEESASPCCRVEIILGLEKGQLFAILPTGVTTDLPFACNAPFMQDPDRGGIKDLSTSPTNRWLLHRVGELAGKALLAWVSNGKLDNNNRAQAYGLLPNVNWDDDSLKGECATLVKKTMANTIRESKFLITEAGELIERERCQAVPELLLKVWSHDQVAASFTDEGEEILSRHVSADNLKKLAYWGWVRVIDNSKVLEVLESKHLPRPESWPKLMMLWAYISGEIYPHWHSASNHTGVKVIPVQGQDLLYAANKVVRLGEKKLLPSKEDWNFLADYLLFLNQKWPRFLAKQKRRAKDRSDEAFSKEVEKADGLLEKLGLGQAADASEVIQQVSSKFFDQSNRKIEDYTRLAQLAATLGVKVTKSFQFVTRDNYRRPVNSYIVADIHNDLNEFIDNDWCEKHVLHDDYNKLLSCEKDKWRAWISSERSKLSTFVPLKELPKYIPTRSRLEEELKARGVDEELSYPYKEGRFTIEDWDFADEHWQKWQVSASGDPAFWARLLLRILEQSPSVWNRALNAKVIQRASNGYEQQMVTKAPIPATWILKFRGFSCLQDKHDKFCQPAELLLRTSDTKPLLEIESFVQKNLDTATNRPLLVMLGVGDTPTKPDRLLNRLLSLSRSDNLDDLLIDAIEKLYHGTRSVDEHMLN